jgi:colanic acid/amylovoran biosynthesis glycosyltransferase
MRIYVFIERYPNPYKPYIDAQLVEFLRLGHEVMIFAGGAYRGTVHQEVLSYRLEEKARYYPETLKDLPKHFLASMFRLISAPTKRLTRIYRSVDKNRSLKFNLMAIARMLVLPTQPPDLCLIHNLSTVASLSFLPAYYPESRVVMYFHGGEVGGAPRVGGEHGLFSRMHAVFTNTQYSRNLAVSRGCKSDKVIILPVGFSLTDYPMPPGKRYRPDGILRLVSVGRLGKEKGFQVALEAVKQLVSSGYTSIHYSIVGSGQQHSELRKFVEDNRLGEYVTFMGELEKREVVHALAGSDVLVLPSLITETWAETQACVVQEAMLMGLIAITTVAGGVPESIPPEMKAFSVEPGEAQAISAKVTDILGMDERELLRLGEAGRKFVVENYDIVQITKTLLAQADFANAHRSGDQAG